MGDHPGLCQWTQGNHKIYMLEIERSDKVREGVRTTETESQEIHCHAQGSDPAWIINSIS